MNECCKNYHLSIIEGLFVALNTIDKNSVNFFFLPNIILEYERFSLKLIENKRIHFITIFGRSLWNVWVLRSIWTASWIHLAAWILLARFIKKWKINRKYNFVFFHKYARSHKHKCRHFFFVVFARCIETCTSHCSYLYMQFNFQLTRISHSFNIL